MLGIKRWPGPRQVQEWQGSDSLAERIMADLADRIMTGKIAAGRNLPDVPDLEKDWPGVTRDQIDEAMTRLARAGMVSRPEGQLWYRAEARPGRRM